MAGYQEATVEFDGGSISIITQFWVSDEGVVLKAKGKLGQLARHGKDFKVTIRRPLNRFEVYRHRLTEAGRSALKQEGET